MLSLMNINLQTVFVNELRSAMGSSDGEDALRQLDLSLEDCMDRMKEARDLFDSLANMNVAQVDVGIVATDDQDLLADAMIELEHPPAPPYTTSMLDRPLRGYGDET